MITVTAYSFFHKIKGHFLFIRALQLFVGLWSLTAAAQTCPPNIDFENGTFDGWKCFIGSTAANNGQNVITLYESGPVQGRHTIYDASVVNPPDQFGGFPVTCPNGSRYSIRLGNDQPGTEAEGLSYEFTIPANQNFYSLIYHYAVVFQDPSHEQYQQPRMEIEITNVTDNVTIDCSSFTFIPNGSNLPGFFQSPNPIDNTPIWCKDWSAVSINLDGNAGKTIRLFFKTADCTFRRHFGYAYIDVNSECSSEFVGANYCPDDTAVNVTAPYGYQSYTWFNSSFTQVLGNQQTIRFFPPPPVGSTIAVEIVPYNGYGCLDTLYANFINTLDIKATAGNDITSCNNNPVQIGANPKSSLVYSWMPAIGLNNPSIANPFASPPATTTYVLTSRNNGGGCVNTDTVVVKTSAFINTVKLKGKLSWCEGYGDSTILLVQPANRIQWFRNNAAIPGADQPEYKVTKTGSYYAILYDKDGCSIATAKQDVLIEKAKTGIIYPVKYAVVDYPLPLESRQFGTTATWSPATHLNNPVSYTPVFNSSTEQFYNIEIKTSSGCITVDGQLVKVVPFVNIYVPTAFTPNNDGLNDLLKPILLGIKKLHYFRVFNRWGQLVFETKDELNGWNGNLKGLLQATQVLVWVAEGTGIDDKVYKRKGTTTLIR